MADGSIKHNQAEGSIHKVAATILGAESCNGWTYWHCDINGRTHPIDYLRQKFISKINFYKLYLNNYLKTFYF
jgi:hypothetical protein